MRSLTAFIFLFLASSTAAQEYYNPVNEAHPGFGPDLTTGADDWQHRSMAYGLFVSSFVNDDRLDDAKRAAKWLIDNQDQHGLGKPGYGLAFAWDAFRNGYVNPVHTVYGITNAIVVQGLLDLHEAVPDGQYLHLAEAVLDAYATEFRDGAFWYSDQPSDRHAVFNVVAMLMGQYARAARVTGRDDFQRLTDMAYAFMMDHHIAGNGRIWRPYSLFAPSRMNDLVHGAYIVRGLIDYRAPSHVIDQAALYLSDYARDGTVYEWVGRSDLLARSWGLGAALNVACELKDTALRDAVLAVLPAYRDGDVYLLRPNDGHYAPRLQAHVAWGRSTCN